jgi:hypothetical protein
MYGQAMFIPYAVF